MSKAEDFQWNINEITSVRNDAYTKGFDAGYKQCKEEMQSESIALEKDRKKLDELRTYVTGKVSLVRDGMRKALTEQNNGKWYYTELFGTNYDRQFQGNLPNDPDEFAEVMWQIVKMGHDFQILIEAFNKHPMVKQSWERLLVMMKMTDNGDNND